MGKSQDPEPDGRGSAQNEATNFTKARIEALPTPQKRRTVYRDSRTRGLSVLVQPSGISVSSG